MTADSRPLKLEQVGFPTNARSQKLITVCFVTQKNERDQRERAAREGPGRTNYVHKEFHVTRY